MSDLYLMKKVITLKKIQVAVKTFARHRKVDATLIASAKIPEYKGSISPSRFSGQLPTY